MREKCGGEAELLLLSLHKPLRPSALLRNRCAVAERAAGAHCGEMNHAAGPEAADEPGRPDSFFSPTLLLLSQRDITHRPGSCCFFVSYYRLSGSQLSERESPHWI